MRNKTTIKVSKLDKTIIIQTNYDFIDFSLVSDAKYHHYNFVIHENYESGGCFLYRDFGGKKYYPKKITIDKIDKENRTVHLSYAL